MGVRNSLIILAVLVLSACAKHHPYKQATTLARQQLADLQDSLAPDCLSAQVHQQVLALQDSIASIESECAVELADSNARLAVFQSLVLVLVLSLGLVLWLK